MADLYGRSTASVRANRLGPAVVPHAMTVSASGLVVRFASSSRRVRLVAGASLGAYRHVRSVDE
jgi:hypothetical protein